MPSTTTTECDRSRNLLFLATPALWGCWPYLPLVRRNPGEGEECGLLCDFLALPKEVFDSPEEVYSAGWRVD